MTTPYQKLLNAQAALDHHDREAPSLLHLPGPLRKVEFEKQVAKRRPLLKAVKKAKAEFDKTRPVNPDDWMSRHSQDLERDEASE
jgi:hypothetical protein